MCANAFPFIPGPYSYMMKLQRLLDNPENNVSCDFLCFHILQDIEIRNIMGKFIDKKFLFPGI